MPNICNHFRIASITRSIAHSLDEIQFGCDMSYSFQVFTCGDWNFWPSFSRKIISCFDDAVDAFEFIRAHPLTWCSWSTVCSATDLVGGAHTRNLPSVEEFLHFRGISCGY